MPAFLRQILSKIHLLLFTRLSISLEFTDDGQSFFDLIHPTATNQIQVDNIQDSFLILHNSE